MLRFRAARPSDRRFSRMLQTTSRGRKLGLEVFESRCMLAVVVDVDDVNPGEVSFSSSDGVPDLLILSVNEDGLLQFAADPNDPPQTLLDGTMLRVTDVPGVMNPPALITRLAIDLGEEDQVVFAQAELPFVFSSPAIDVLVEAGTISLDTTLLVAEGPGVQLFRLGNVAAPDETRILVRSESVVRANQVLLAGALDGGQMGDLNLDGQVDGNDLLEWLTARSDVNSDGAVNVQDVLVIVRSFGDVSSLTVEATERLEIHGPVGTDETAPLQSLTTSAPQMVLRGDVGRIATIGDQVYEGSILLAADTEFHSSGGSIHLGGAIDAIDDSAAMTSVAGLTASAPAGGILFEGEVGGDNQDGLTSGLDSDQDGLRHLTVAAVNPALTIRVMAAAVITTENQAYNGPVRLLGDVNLMSLGTVTFADALDGAHELTITAGEARFEGAVGGVEALESLDLNGLPGGNTIFIGGPVATAGDQVYNDAVVLTADAALASTTGSVTFESTVDSDAMGPWSLTVTVPATGAVTFRGRAGTGTAPLLPLNVLTISGESVFDIGSPDRPSLESIGDQTYGGPVLLMQDVELQSDSGDVTFLGTVRGAMDGQQALIINTSGITEFQQVVGPVGMRLRELATGPGPNPQAGDPDQTRIGGGQIATTGDQTYEDSVVLTSNAQLQSDASILLSGTINGDGDPAGPWDLTLQGAMVRLGDTVGNDEPLDSLQLNGPVQIAASTIRTQGNQTYNAAVTLEGNLVLTSPGAGNVSFAGPLGGPFSLQIDTAGTTMFAGAVNDLASLTTLGGGTTQINADITTTGLQTYGDAVMLGAPLVTLTSTGSGDITFEQTLSGTLTQSLAVNTGGTTTFDGPVTSLQNLATDAAGAGETHINSDVTTAGDQTYGDAVVLGAASVTLTSTVAGDIAFQSTLTGTGTPPSSLIVNTGGTTTFAGAVTDLTNLTTDGAGGDQTHLNADITTVGSQTYGDAVVLGATVVTLTSTASGDITFLGTVNSVDGQQSLIVNTSGSTEFTEAVGTMANMALAALTTGPSPNVADPGQTRIGGGQITTTGDQTYHDGVVLTSNAVLHADEDILFNGTVDGDGAPAGPWDLTVEAALIRLGGGVGNVEPLDSMLVDGPVRIAGSVVRTAGSQTYNGAVVLEVTTAATSSAGNITFMESVDAADDGNPASSAAGLTVDRRQGSAEVIFFGPVGSGAGGADPQGLAALNVLANGLVRLIDTTGDPDIRTLGELRIEVLQAAINSAGDDLIVSGGVVIESTGGNVALSADDVTVVAGASITAAATLSIQLDHGAPGGDPGGVFQALGISGLLGGGAGVLISGLAGDDAFHIHAARLRAGDDHSITGLGGSDLVDMTFDDANEWAAPDTALSIQGGSGNDTIELNFEQDAVISTQSGTVVTIDGDGPGGTGLDTIHFDHSDDTLPRLVQFQFRASAMGGDVAIGGFGTATGQLTDPLATTATFTITNADAYKLLGPAMPSIGSHLQIRGAATTANQIGVAGVVPPADPPATSSSFQIPSYVRNRPTAVPNVPEVVPAQTVSFQRQFFVQGYDCLHLIGGNEADILVNETNLPALIEGNGGNDQLVGGGFIDVLFAGGGLDVLLGGSGDDLLFADVGLAFTGSQAAPIPVASPGSPFADPPGFDPADLLFGGPGLNHAAQVGLDLVSGISGMLLDGGATKDVVSWLRAQLMVFSSGNLQMLINNAFFGGNGKTGLTNVGCNIEDFAVDRFPLPATALPAAPQPLLGLAVGEDPQHTGANGVGASASFASADAGPALLRDSLFSDLSWMSFGR